MAAAGLEKVFLVLAMLILLQSLVALRDGFRFLRFAHRSRRRPLGDYTPLAAVIIPCKGIDAESVTNAERFLAQDYPRYEVVFVVASEQDAAHAPLKALLARRAAAPFGGATKASLLVAGYSEERGEKVHNLLRGLTAVPPGAEVLVFADVDGRPKRDWLRSLVAPLGDPAVTVSTGFRWYLPGDRFVSRLRAAWDTSIATMLGDHDHNFAWGGSMAIPADDFRRLQVAERYWARTVSDDYALTRAVREARGRIRFEPRCLIASREHCTWHEFRRWSTRQILITRVYAARLWWMGLASYVLYCGTLLWGVLLLALPGATLTTRAAVAALVVTIVLLGMAKGRLRATLARELFPEEKATLDRYGASYWRLAPLVPWVMLFNFVAAGLTRRIEWRGTHYELRSRDEVRLLRRDGV